MRIEIQEVDILRLKRDEAIQLRGELNKLTNGALVFHSDKYPLLVELDKLLAGCFSNSVNGVHFISKHE